MTEVVYLSTPTCIPCKTFGPLINEVAREQNIAITKVDATTDKYYVSKFKVAGVPTVLFLRNGIEVDRQTGITTKSILVSKFERLGKL